MNAIEIRNLTKTFGTKRAVDNLNMTVLEGAIYGFIGENGSGKSTTEKLICGLIHENGGSIRLYGRDRTDAEIRSKIGVLIEAPGAFPNMSVWSNMLLHIDETFADEMLRVKNFVPAISVEGFEAATDFRRGEGTYRAVTRAMKILRDKKLPFGLSCCYTSQNTEVIGSEEYFDWMVESGAKFCWLFTYMPVGKNTVPSLMVSPEQRKFMYEQVRKFRDTKPIFTMDFWNDGEYSGYVGHPGGCIAGGRRYLHINANADMDPCAFIHYSDTNLREKTLLEGLRSPLFMAYRRNQPFSDNLLRPCPLLDNQGALAKMVKDSGAHSTDVEALISVTD